VLTPTSPLKREATRKPKNKAALQNASSSPSTQSKKPNNTNT